MIKFKLKVLLAMHDMTQKKISEITDIRQPTISAICNNNIKQLPIDALDKLCAALNCQPADIMEYIPDKLE